MIASLGMYDRAETAAANDRLWGGIRDGLRSKGIAAPEALTRGEGAYWPAWTAPDLVFSQTCGFPFRAKLHDKVTLIGTPDYGLPGCAPGHYASVYIARKSDPRKTLAEFAPTRFAFNESLSQSGWAAPANHFKALGLALAPNLQSGGHRLSAQAVLENRADFAALDLMTWTMIQRWDAWAADLRVITRTAPSTPTLPFITAKGNDAELFFKTIAQAIAELSPDDKATLHLQGLVYIPVIDYISVPTPHTAQIDQK